MKRIILAVVAIAATLSLAGCAKVKPIVVWTCVGCKALLSSGACTMVAASDRCKPGEVLVIENWNDVSRNGAAPVLGCEKQKGK